MYHAASKGRLAPWRNTRCAVPIRLGTSSTFIIFLALLACVAGRASADSITYTDDAFQQTKQDIGDIEPENYDVITIEALQEGQKVKKNILSNHVIRITHAKNPPAYVAAQMMEKDDKYKEAVDAYTGVAKDEKSPEWAKWYSMHRVGQIYMMLADQLNDRSYLEKAVEAFQAVTKSWPKARHAPDAWVTIGQAWTTLGKLKEAKEQFDQALSPDRKYPDLYQFRARVGLARIQVMEAMKLPRKERRDALQKAADAAASIMDLTSKKLAEQPDPALVEFRYEGMLVRAEALLEMGVFDLQYRRDAESLCHEIVNGSKRFDLKAYASNFRGDSLRQRGLTREAYFAYITTAVLYFQDKYAHQKALYWSAICAARQGKPLKAKEHQRDLAFYYPKSEWLTKLNADLPGAEKEGTGKKE